MEPEELPHWLRLELTPGVGPVVTCRLLKAIGSPEAVFRQSQDALADVVGPALAHALKQCPPEHALLTTKAQAWLVNGRPEPWSRRVLGWADVDYPAPLLELHDPPPLLWVMQPSQMSSGQMPLVWPQALAVVGSRNPSAQGTLNAQAFARALADAGCTIVSGLAWVSTLRRTAARWPAEHRGPRWPSWALAWTGSTPGKTRNWHAPSHSAA